MDGQSSIPLTLYLPAGGEELALLVRRRAAVHADLILAQIQALPCPGQQKRLLLEQVMDALREDQP